jgi:hypothetical protein
MKIKNLNEIAAIRDYHSRIGAESVSFKRAEIRETTPQGYPKAVVTIVYDRKAQTIKLYPNIKDKAPTAEELQAIIDGITTADFPNSTVASSLPDFLFKEAPEFIFPYWDETNTKIGFVEHRINEKNGGKIYLPWTYFDDGEWRQQEPDDGMPLYGLWGLKAGPKRIMLHEGAKAARGAQRAADDTSHPFHESMSLFTHLGWSGGTERARSTQWKSLHGVDDITICPDNDVPGRKVLRQLSILMPKVATIQAIIWPGDFPISFDLGDDPLKIPQKYVDQGWQPTMSREQLTWSTEERTIDDKAVYFIRDSFAKQWVYVAHNDLFVDKTMPSLFYTSEVFDKQFRRLSHVKKLSELMINNENVDVYHERTYLPGSPIGAYKDDHDRTVFNIYTPTRIRPVKGDVTLFKDFLAKLFPVEPERIAVTDFIATMVARPQQRPEFGMLMYSVKQGTGKTTLCNFLETLVGRHNVSLPDASTIVDDAFNTWVANKVLAVCAEIYEGHSWKAYLKLKSKITDRSLELKEKYMTNRTIPNFLWVIACSNSSQALRIEEGDRRWLIPVVTEEPAGKEYFTKLYAWFENCGACHVLDWFLNYERPYLTAGSAALMTSRKIEMIEGSDDEDVRKAISILEFISEKLVEQGKPPAFMFDITQLRHKAQEGIEHRDCTPSRAFTQKLIQKGLVRPFRKIRRGQGTVNGQLYTPTIDSVTFVCEDFANFSDFQLDTII